MMEQVSPELHWQTLLLYLDNVVVFLNDFDNYALRLDKVLSQLLIAGLPLKTT